MWIDTAGDSVHHRDGNDVQLEMQSLVANNFDKQTSESLDLLERDKDILSLHGYVAPLWKQITFTLFGIATFGVGFLAARWFLLFRIKMTLRPTHLAVAEYVLVSLIDHQQDLVPVSRARGVTSGLATVQMSGTSECLHGNGGLAPVFGSLSNEDCGRMMEYRCGRYMFNEAAGTFLPIPATPVGLTEELTAAAISRRIKGPLADDWQRAVRRARYGPNELIIPVKSPLELLGEEMVHPFYVFQYASVAIWCLEAYYSYSLIIVAITMFSIVSTVIQTYRYRRRLAALAHHICEVEVIQPGGGSMTLSSADLVPGDVVVVRPGMLPCDIVLLRGEAIVDENMLTGEAVPVRKVAYTPAANGSVQYDADVAKDCTLYGGTTVAQARPGGVERVTLGVVARTGFWTAKGQLLKSILYPRQHKQTFATDALAFIAVMLCLGLAFYVWDVIALASYGAPASFIVLRYLDLITVAVPPALPACLTVATAIAVSRLAEHGIFVSNPAAINAAGHLDVICFDKTGTLTESGLGLKGVVPVVASSAATAVVDPQSSTIVGPNDALSFEDAARKAMAAASRKVSRLRCGRMFRDGHPLPMQFQELLATCHGLAQLDGALVGDPLEQRLFEATGWSMLDEGAGAAVEIVAVPEEDEEGLTPTSPSGNMFSPRHRFPASPGVLINAHVRTRVCPPIETRTSSSAAASSLANGAAEAYYSIIRRFEFSSETQRSVVVVATPDGILHVHAKGSPEMLRELADPGSIPDDFDSELGKYTSQGLRVLALATRRLEGVTEANVSTMSQDVLERGIQFLGFAVMINALREDTASVLAELQDAGIRTVMVTGDHAKTAVSVARHCGIVGCQRRIAFVDTSSGEGRVEDAAMTMAVADPEDHEPTVGDAPLLLEAVARGELDAAATGRGFERLVFETESGHLLSNGDEAGACNDAVDERGDNGGVVGGGGLHTVLHRCSVFARMSPDDKRLLVELLGEGTGDGSDGSKHDENKESLLYAGLGHHVGFCGDGANDVGALKAAHVGVSLCEAEASVAAPLTSKRQTIACMLTVVAEGRASLSTSYVIFKWIIVYAFIQVFGVNLMYSFGGSVGNYQYLIQDLLYTTVLAGTMGFTRPASKLTTQRPPERLMSAGVWFPVIAQFTTCAAFQLAALQALARQPWYIRFDPEPGSTGTNCFARATSNSPECSSSWENSAVFIMSLGQFLITAVVFNKGPPHRRPLWTNPWLLAAMLAQTSFLLFLIFSDGDVVSKNFAGMVPFPEPLFRAKLALLLMLNFGTSWLAETLAIMSWSALKGRRLCGVTIL